MPGAGVQIFRFGNNGLESNSSDLGTWLTNGLESNSSDLGTVAELESNSSYLGTVAELESNSSYLGTVAELESKSSDLDSSYVPNSEELVWEGQNQN
jgi:hypothetical protein